MAARNGKCTVPGFVYKQRKIIAAIIYIFIFFEERAICFARAGIGLCRQRSPVLFRRRGGRMRRRCCRESGLGCFLRLGAVDRSGPLCVDCVGWRRPPPQRQQRLFPKRGVRQRIQRRPCQCLRPKQRGALENPPVFSFLSGRFTWSANSRNKFCIRWPTGL